MARTFDIPKRQLGGNGPLLPAIGLGCMSMSPGIYGGSPKSGNVPLSDLPVDESGEIIASGIATLKRAIEDGCIFWDTANAYGMGHNERVISRVLKDNRDKVFICTKFAIRLYPGGRIGICTKRVKYMEENLGASDVTITDEDDKELRKHIDDIGVTGERYDAHGMAAINL
ncbi:NADP-dependent oxidoreductase domain-containing protein [Syncephalis plumigaleata]|nr:NADP-dependent oxidoreductase domain-containing protein [Syncephalis plumigaleata]